ncbi:SDR family oxidoreductase [Streptomyces oceani]|uniref:NAD(P)-binding domain-containing protein n=1 Tax=Streptomyces oceani TaxID=1075402 RepID=A0A1E7JWC3_9ACTN|nr:NAD(P)H-binding protein [Streptomyces oceani]OEU95952.1 hypothetical protein AN216_22700 [Streptomyces oceani]
MILVAGATGNIGGPLVRQLVDAGADVRALSRDTGKVTAPTGVEVTRADLAQPASLEPAFAGGEALFLLANTGGAVAGVLAAAQRVGVRRVVLVTSLLARTHPESFVGRSAQEDERAVHDSGVQWTVLRPWEFASNVLAWAPMIRDTGVVSLPRTGLPSPTIHPADIAAVAARALAEDGHGGLTYSLTGPELLTPADKVNTLADVLGRALELEERPDPQALQRIEEQAPDEPSQGLMVPGVSGLASPDVLTTAHEVTGSPARTFRQWAQENTHAFTPTRQT